MWALEESGVSKVDAMFRLLKANAYFSWLVVKNMGVEQGTKEPCGKEAATAVAKEEAEEEEEKKEENEVEEAEEDDEIDMHKAIEDYFLSQPSATGTGADNDEAAPAPAAVIPARGLAGMESPLARRRYHRVQHLDNIDENDENDSKATAAAAAKGVNVYNTKTTTLLASKDATKATELDASDAPASHAALAVATLPRAAATVIGNGVVALARKDRKADNAMRADITDFVRQQLDINANFALTPRAVARIMQGLSSPAYPYQDWCRSKYWKRYAGADFRVIMKHAAAALQVLRSKFGATKKK